VGEEGGRGRCKRTVDIHSTPELENTQRERTVRKDGQRTLQEEGADDDIYGESVDLSTSSR
jgi:hypothetical protein